MYTVTHVDIVLPWWLEPGAPGPVTDHLPSELSELREMYDTFVL